MRVVAPQETRPPRMGALAVLPVFVDLAGRRAVVAGGGEAAAWKAELLAAAGARVEVYADAPCDELLALSRSPPAGSMAVVARCWQPDDLEDAALAVGALEGAEAEAFADAARARGVPVNVVDTPAVSTFSFGAIVNRSPVVIGISTAGSAPVLGQAIRTRIEALLHPALAQWAAAARHLREEVSRRLAMGPRRREVWRRFAEAALAARSGPGSRDVAALLMTPTSKCGSVALVGAGPGDPELLTLKALRALQSADVILYDHLVSAEILELARREARRLLVGKTGGGPSCRQDEINRLMVRLAREGRRVVRLKGGDPMVFGRAAEEMEACRAAGVPVEVVPGITAALGAAAELQIPLTDRRAVRRLQLVTGHAERRGLPDLDWTSLADPGATTVLYMGSKTFAQLLPKLIEAGLDPATPALAAASATLPRSSHMRCTVSDLPEVLAGMEGAGPCLIMIGRVCASAGADAAGLRDVPEAQSQAGLCAGWVERQR